MGESPPSLILLDFFGTMVDYSDSWTEQGYHQSHEALLVMGADVSYEQFLERWSAIFVELNQQNAESHREFSMEDVATIFLLEVLGRKPSSEQVAAIVDTYGTEWDTGVVYPEWIQSVSSSLAERYQLGVVSNTHKVGLVRKHLEAMGVAGYVDTVVTSIEHGYRKPHPSIYAEALGRLGVEASAAVFVGDDYEADYLGAKQAGMTAYHISPEPNELVPVTQQLRSLSDLPGRLAQPQ